MNTSTITDQLSDTFTETVPTAIADTISEVGALIETVPEFVAGSVDAGVAGGRRFARRAADQVPGVSVAESNRRWWLIAAVIGVAAVVGIVWYTRRSDDATDTNADVSDIGSRHNVA